MRLLNVANFELTSFDGVEGDIPSYAILSHTWGNDEISFQDIQKQSLEYTIGSPAFGKIRQSCLQARRDGLQYVWIDTCCINKENNSELSEAINSMFKWYQQSAVCYAFLSDYDSGISPRNTNTKEPFIAEHDISFFVSRWFTRGWTLQELIAPRNVVFFDQNWVVFGTRDGTLLSRVCQRTGIWPQVFNDERRCSCLPSCPSPPVRDGICSICGEIDSLPQTLDTFAVSVKMSWASSRVTTRKEDAAYSLLGLFDINIPMLYGEGDKAFLRLQDAIVRHSKDQSILLWRANPSDALNRHTLGCLAPSPLHFKEPVRIIARRVFSDVEKRYEADFLGNMAPIEITDTCIRTHLWMCPCTVNAYDPYLDGFKDQSLWLGILDLAHDDDHLVRPAILLEHMGLLDQIGDLDIYRRVYNSLVVPINPRQEYSTLQMSIDLHDRNQSMQQTLADRATISITRSLDAALQKDIGILLQRRTINVAKRLPSLDKGPATGPVYFIFLPQKVRCVADSGGSLPPFSMYTAHATQISPPWTFEKCHHGAVERFIGGLHFLNLELNRHPKIPRDMVHTAVIWGMHRDYPLGGKELGPWKLWCRIFDMNNFINSTRTSDEDLHPSQLYQGNNALPAGEISRRMKNQRRRLALEGYEDSWVHGAHHSRKLFPDSCDDDWTKDQMQNQLVRLSASVSRTQGLGRTLFELRVACFKPNT